MGSSRAFRAARLAGAWQKSVGAILLRQTALSDRDIERLLSAWPDEERTATDGT